MRTLPVFYTSRNIFAKTKSFYYEIPQYFFALEKQRVWIEISQSFMNHSSAAGKRHIWKVIQHIKREKTAYFVNIPWQQRKSFSFIKDYALLRFAWNRDGKMKFFCVRDGWLLQNRLEICRNRHDRRSCKIISNCVIIS